MKIHELLSDETKWTQNVHARDKDGHPLWSSHPQAVCWCLMGAVDKCYPGTNRVGELIVSKIKMPIDEWNDLLERTYEDVYSLVKNLDI
jgi:hypothetical protein